jgi:hypothetical protein
MAPICLFCNNCRLICIEEIAPRDWSCASLITVLKTNENNVLEYFCEIISNKTQMKNLNPTQIMNLVEDMNKVSESGQWEQSQRLWAINKLCKLAGKKELDPSEVHKTRSWFTPVGPPLTKATMSSAAAAGGKYEIRSFNDNADQPIAFTNNPTKDEQIAHSRAFKLYKNKTITNIKRKKCATCWMCQKPIYVYKIEGTDTNKGGATFNDYIDCGQDEHVLPPGWGNIVGVLWGNLEDQDKYNVNTHSSLAPSHAWCNQVKGDELFITLPKSKQWEFSINQQGIDRFKAKGISWLTYGTGNTLDHNMFYKYHTGEQQFMNSIESHIKNHMTTLIRELNINIQKTKAYKPVNNYTTFMLRTTLCLAYIWVNYVTKNTKLIHGGGNMNEDFVSLRNVPLEKINTDLLASTIFGYKESSNDTNELTVKSFYDTNAIFANNEASMICYINTAAATASYTRHLRHLPDNTVSWWSQSSFKWNPTITEEFDKTMGNLGYGVGLIIYHSYLAPEIDDSDEPAIPAGVPEQGTGRHGRSNTATPELEGGAQKIGKKRDMITINRKSINTKKHKSIKDKSRKLRKHKSRKLRKHKSRKLRNQRNQRKITLNQNKHSKKYNKIII